MNFNELPLVVQNLLKQNKKSCVEPEYEMESQSSVYQYHNEPIYLISTLEYDFDEANYQIYTVNLTEIQSHYFQATSVDIFKKTMQGDAYIIQYFNSEEGGTCTVYKCV